MVHYMAETTLDFISDEIKTDCDGDDVEVVSDNALTADERRDFKRLDSAFNRNQRESVKALREIRLRKLFREDFSSFDEFMASKGHTRQWATQQINWLRRQELFEKKAGKQTGKVPYQLSIEEAQCLGALEPDYVDDDCDHDLYAEQFVEAVVEAQKEAEAKGKRRTVEMVKKAVNKRLRFIENRESISDDLTLDESAQIDRLGGQSHDELKKVLADAKKAAKKKDRSAADCLKEKVDQLVAKEQKEQAKEKLRQERGRDKPAQNDRKLERKENPKQQTVDDSEDDQEVVVLYDVQLTGEFAPLLEERRSVDADGVITFLDAITDLVVDGALKDGGFHLIRCDESNAVEDGQGEETV